METSDINYDPFAHGEISCVIGATPQQREIWLASQYSQSASLAYSQGIVIQLPGTIDEEILEKSLVVFSKKHPLARATFSPDGKYICISQDPAFELKVDDQSQLKDKELNNYIKELKNKLALAPFDLTFGPLIKATLVKHSITTNHLIIVTHHVICDGASLSVLAQELSETYRTIQDGNWSIDDINIFDAKKIQAAIDPTKYHDDYAYWSKEYKKLPDSVEMPMPPGYTRPVKRTFNSQRVKFGLSKQCIQALDKVSVKVGCTFPVLAYSVFVALIYRLTNHTDLVVGLPVSVRNLTNQNGSFGHHVSILPLRHQIDESDSFESFVNHVSQKVYSGSTHASITLNDLINTINLPRDNSRVPLVPITFNTNQSNNVLDFGNFVGSYEYLRRSSETFEIAVNLIRRKQDSALLIDFNTDLFDERTILHWAECFQTLAESIGKDSALSLSQCNIISKKQLYLMSDWNSTKFEYPSETSLAQIIEQRSTQNGENPAIIYMSESYSYREISKRSNRLANFLKSEFKSQPFLAAVCMDRSIDLVVSLLGILKAGGAYLPLDPEYPPDRITYILKDSNTELVITEEPYLPLLANGATDCRKIVYSHKEQELKQFPDTFAPVAQAPNRLAYVIYTSGSTGNPKGVRVNNKNVVNFLSTMQMRPGIQSRDNLLAVTTFSFDISVLELFLPLIAGATVTLATKEDATDPYKLKSLLDNTNVTILQATPATWKMLIDAGWDGKKNLKGLIGGEALPADLVQPLLNRIDELWNMYGPTETTVWSTCQQISNSSDPILIGKPIGNTQVYVADRQGNRMPLGAYGELYIGGDGVTDGYLGRPELTAEKFVENLWVESDPTKVYRTGDLVQLTLDGYLRYIARLDNQIKIRGYRIELGEIETAVVGLDFVQECVVTTQDFDGGDIRLVAYLTLIPGSHLDVKAIRTHLSIFLPAYMIPQHFVEIPEVPLTPSGKVDRKSLPKPGLPVVEKVLKSPESDIEIALADLWCAVLGIDKVGVEDSFFDLGGHSLLAVRLSTQIKDKFALNLNLRVLFSNPTLKEQALLIEGLNHSSTLDDKSPGYDTEDFLI